MMPAEDTIIAVSTARGPARRAVIRLSGDEALFAVEDVFQPTGDTARNWKQTYTVTAGMLRLSGEGLSVPVFLYVMLKPHSYTREDVVEIHLPGSQALLDMVLDEFLQRGGVRLAEPGEFTRRAFLNGRIDLAQAEAVLAVVRARNEAELLAAGARLEGRTSRECALLQDRVGGLRALVEAALDFAEHDIELISERELLDELAAIRTRLQDNLEGARGELASDGTIHVTICGPPNAGKSSLLNRLAGEEKAIVHPMPGTTRDPVGAEVEVHGIRFAVTDTAGLELNASGLEAAAAQMTRSQLKHSQLVLFVLDASRKLSGDELEVVRGVPPQNVLLVLNKCDLPQELDAGLLSSALPGADIICTSALTGEGIDELREALGRVVFEGRLDASAADCLFNARQREALRKALSHTSDAEQAAEAGLGYEFVALHLREVNDDLGAVTGQVCSSDVLDRIFSRFCIGK